MNVRTYFLFCIVILSTLYLQRVWEQQNTHVGTTENQVTTPISDTSGKKNVSAVSKTSHPFDGVSTDDIYKQKPKRRPSSTSEGFFDINQPPNITKIEIVPETVSSIKNSDSRFPNIDIGYDWVELYGNESKETIDSVVGAIRYYDTSIGNSILKTIIDVCGKYFFRENFSSISKKLINNVLSSEPIINDPMVWAKQLSPLLDSLPYAFSSLEPFQIWNPDYKFTVFYPAKEGRNFKESSIYYSNKINTLEVYFNKDSGRYVIPEFDKLFHEFTLIKEEKLRLEVLFLFLTRLHVLSANDYLTTVTETIVNVCVNSSVLDNMEKAYWITGCAKLLATNEPFLYANYIYPYLMLAEGEVCIDKNDSVQYYRRLQIFKALHLSSIPEISFKNNAYTMIYEQFKNEKNYTDIRFAFQNLAVLSSLYSSIALEYVYKGEEVPANEKLGLATLIASTHRYYQLIQYDKEDVYISFYRQLYLNSIYAYCYLERDYRGALTANMLLLKHLVDSKNEDDKFLLKGIIHSISDLHTLIGNTEKANTWETMVTRNDTSQSNRDVKTLESFPSDYRLWNKNHFKKFTNLIGDFDGATIDTLYLSPLTKAMSARGLRLILLKSSKIEAEKKHWKKAYHLQLKAESFKGNFNIGYFTGMAQSGARNFYLPEKLKAKDSLKRLEDSLLSLFININEAQIEIYLLGKKIIAFSSQIETLDTKVDDLVLEREKLRQDTFTLNREKVRLSKEIAKANSSLKDITVEYGNLRDLNDQLDSAKKQANIERDNAIEQKDKAQTYFFITFLAAIISIITAFFGFYQRKRAILQSKFNQYKSNIWQEFGHISKTTVWNAFDKIKKSGDVRSSLVFLDMLDEFSKTMFRCLSQSKDVYSTLSQELHLVKIYLQFNNLLNKTNISLSTTDFVKDIKLPPAVILNLTSNAIKHGKLLTQGFGVVKISIVEQGKGYRVTVSDDGSGFPKHIKKIRDISDKDKTGLKNGDSVITLYNSFKPPKREGKEDSKIIKFLKSRRLFSRTDENIIFGKSSDTNLTTDVAFYVKAYDK